MIKQDTCSQWIPDFVKRLKQISSLASIAPEAYTKEDIWLGGFASPEAFVAASRQAVARAHEWSLEELELVVSVNDSSDRADSFTFTGFELNGAAWKDGSLAIDTESLIFPLPPVRFSWKRKEKGKTLNEGCVKVPVYLDSSRSQFLFSVMLRTPQGLDKTVWHQRGTAIIVWGRANSQ
jgi:dynein heavy chain 1